MSTSDFAPIPLRTIVHLSDTHLLADEKLLGGIDTTANLQRALERLREMNPAPSAIVVTGDLTDLGEGSAYTRLRTLIEPVAAELGAELVWVAGNHDERAPLRQYLLGEQPSAEPLIGEWSFGGLRLLRLDTSVPGWHHGELDAGQLQWLKHTLQTPAPLGTLLALHHPPLPSHVPLFAILDLKNQSALAEIIAGSDVRGILAGHLHYSTFGTFAGVPVSVASATCYAMDVGRAPEYVNGMDAAQAFNLVHVWEDTITHTVVPVSAVESASTFTPEWYEHMAHFSEEERLARFSRKQT